MALTQDVVRRLTVIATDNGLTTLTTKLNAVDAAQDRVAVSSTRMGRATEDAQRRIAAITSQGTGAVLGGRTATSAVMGVLGPIAAGVVAVYTAWKLLNATIEQGVALLEKYGIAGQRAVYGFTNEEALKKLTRFQEGGQTTLEQQRYATELSDRLDLAQTKISKFFKEQFDLTDPALRLQNAWVRINEQLAGALDTIGKIGSAMSKLPDQILRSLPGVGGAYMAAKYIYTAATADKEQPEVAAEQAMVLARKRLAAGMGGGFQGRFGAVTDTPKDEKKETKDPTGEFERMEKSLQRQAAAMEAESKAVGASAGEHARLRTEMRLQEAAMQDIAKNGGSMDEYEARIKKIADRFGEATQKAAELKLANDITFERSQIGRDPIEAGIASRLRPIYGDDYVNQMNSATAAAIRFNEQLKQAKDLTTEFVTGFAGEFRTQLRQGVSAWEAFSKAGLSALTRLSDKLMDMILSNMVTRAFGGLLGAGGLTLSGGLGVPNALTSQSAMGGGAGGGVFGSANGNAFYGGNVIPFARGGIVSSPTLFPMARGMGLMGESGPEAVMPLSRGRDGRLGVSGGGGGANVQVNVYNNASGTEAHVEKRQEGGVDIYQIVVSNYNKAAGRGDVDKANAGARVRQRGVRR